MNTLVKIVIYGGPVLLAVLASLAIDKKPQGAQRWAWWGSFALLAALSVGASVLDSLSTDERATQIWEHLTGGDNFVVIRANEDDMKARKEELRFEISSTGPLPEVRFWIHPASTKGNANDPDYYKFKDKGGGGVFASRGKVGGLMGIQFPIGSYRIEMDASNGHYVEMLNIYEFNGVIVQTIDLQKSGKLIFSSRRP